MAWQQHERNDIHVFLLFYLQPRGIIAPKCDHSLQRESREPPRLLPNERQHGGSPLYFSSLLLFLKLFFFLFLLFCIFVPGTTKAVSGREESFNCRSLAPNKNLIRKEEKTPNNFETDSFRQGQKRKTFRLCCCWLNSSNSQSPFMKNKNTCSWQTGREKRFEINRCNQFPCQTIFPRSKSRIKQKHWQQVKRDISLKE